MIVITCELADFTSVINNFYALLWLSSHAADYTDRPGARIFVQDYFPAQKSGHAALRDALLIPVALRHW